MTLYKINFKILSDSHTPGNKLNLHLYLYVPVQKKKTIGKYRPNNLVNFGHFLEVVILSILADGKFLKYRRKISARLGRPLSFRKSCLRNSRTRFTQLHHVIIYKTGKRKRFWRLIFAVRMRKHACVLIFKNKIPCKPCLVDT